MDIPITSQLESICQDIRAKNYSMEQWAQVESDDMFQSGSFCGGFDADESEFCFSFYATNGKEYWFQIDLKMAIETSNGKAPSISGRTA